MKYLVFFFAFILLTNSDCIAQVITGDAIVFEYDDNGARHLRYYVNPIQINREGKPVDSLIEKLDKGETYIKVYPNPVADVLNIENLSWQEGHNATIQVFDITGKLVYERTTSQAKETVTFTPWAAGTYQVHYSLNGHSKANWKIVKNQ